MNPISLGPAIILVLASAQGSAAPQPAAPRRLDPAAADIARNAPLLGVLPPPAPDDDGAVARFDIDRAGWRVLFRRHGRPVLRVDLDDATGRIVGQVILRADGSAAMPVGEAEARARAVPAVRDWLNRRSDAWLAPLYDFERDVWRVSVLESNRPVGMVLVFEERTHTEGPWLGSPGPLGKASRVLQRLRAPRMGLGLAGGLAALAAVVLLIDLRHPWSLRLLDGLVLAAIVAGRLAGPLRLEFALGMGGVVYLTVRLLGRGLWGRPGRPGPAPHPVVPVLLALAAVWWVVQDPRASVISSAEKVGLVRGARFFATGSPGYGEGVGSFREKGGEDIFGPVHYGLYGAAAQVFPIGVDWRQANIADYQTHRRMNLDGAVAVALVMHGITVAAVTGLCLRLGGTVRSASVVAAAYVLFSVALGRFFSGSQVPSGALIAVGLWAWPNPYVAAVCLGTATASMWFPLLLFPLWLGSWRGRDRLKFALAYCATGAVFFAMALLGGGSLGHRVSCFFQATVVSLAREEPAHWLQSAFRPVSLGLCVFAFWWPWRRRDRSAVARRMRVVALSAGLLASTQIWRVPHGPDYLGIHLPYALVALFASPPPPRRPAAGVPPT